MKPDTGIDLRSFTTTDVADRFHSELGNQQLHFDYEPGMALLFGHPVVITRDRISQFLSAAFNIVTWFEEEICTDVQKLTQWIGGNGHSRAGTLLGQSLNVLAVNQHLVDLIRKGYRLPFAYDLMGARNTDGSRGFKCVEFQAYPAPVWQARRIAMAAKAAAPQHLADAQIDYRDPLGDCRLLLSLTDGEPIIVMDTQSMHQYSRIDQTDMARDLGDEQSYPIEYKDIVGKNEKGEWIANERDTDDQVTRQVVLKHVFCRSVPYDILDLERQLKDDPAKLAILVEFFTDPTVNWISHPAWSNLLDKRDLDLLQKWPETQPHHLRAYYAGQTVPPGKYKLKPLEGMGGKNQEEITVAEGKTETVPSGMMAQEFIDLDPYQVELPFGQTADATIELRVAPLPTFDRRNADRGATLFPRVAPRESVVDGKTVLTHTNAANISLVTAQQFLPAFQARLGISNTLSPHHLPFGYAAGLIKSDTAHSQT
jgi:hypothetical protein